MAEALEQQEKWRNVDENEILNGMTAEEIEQLNFELMEMDPDNCDLPAGLRQMDHTKKAPTGPLDRDALLKHLQDEAAAVEDQDELVPYEAGTKRGKVYVPPKKQGLGDGFGGGSLNLEPEIIDALDNATEAELTDLAAILGMHTLMDNEQYYASLEATDGKIANTVGFSVATKCKLPVATAEDMAAMGHNETNVEETLEKLKNNDSSLTEVNLNNIRNIPVATLKDYASAFANNSNCTEFSLVGTRCNNGVATELAAALSSNTTLQKVNLETNYLGWKPIVEIIETLTSTGNTSLTELKVDNQKQPFGPNGEQSIADALELNKSLIKFSLGFRCPGPRQKAVAAMTRNADNRLRKSRVNK